MIFKKKECTEESGGMTVQRKQPRFSMRRISKNRKVVSLLCIILAAIFSFVVLPKMYKQQSDTTMVVMVTDTIKKGEIIKSEKLISKEVGAYGLPKGVLSDLSVATGKVAKVDLLADDYLTPAKFGDFVSDPVIENIVKQGKQLTTVSLQSNAAGLAAHLQKGDKVNIGVARETQGGVYLLFDAELKGLEIYDIENDNAVSVEDIKSAKGYDAADAIPKTVTFVTTEQQSAKLLDAEYNGKLHLSLAKR